MRANVILLTLAGWVALVVPASAEEPCGKVEVEYARGPLLSANLRLSNTSMGKGDGIYPIGPGTLVLRFEGTPPNYNDVKLGFYKMHASITIHARFTVWWATVRTETDHGSACGMFGAPRSGKTEVQVGPGDAPFGTFYFSEDMATFTMPSAPAMTTRSPKQTSQIAISGREVKRTCVSGSCR